MALVTTILLVLGGGVVTDELMQAVGGIFHWTTMKTH